MNMASQCVGRSSGEIRKEERVKGTRKLICGETAISSHPSLSSKARNNPAVKIETREGDIIALPSDQARWEAEAGALKSEACAPSSPSFGNQDSKEHS